MTRNVNGQKEMRVNEQIFLGVLRGSGGRHVFSTYEQLSSGDIEKKVLEAERDFGINAWQKNIGIVTPPLHDTEMANLRRLFCAAGYGASMSNEEDSFGSMLLVYALITLVRRDVVAT